MYTQPELKKIVDTALINLAINTESQRLIDPVKYVLSMGGKRLRPVIALMACNLFSDKIDPAIIPVSGLEVFHNFTLVHDDIMDNANVRRGFATVHNKWNLNQAILSGDVMAFITNECFLQSPPEILQKIFRIFNKAAIEVCIGQQIDMDFEKASIVTQEEYLRMIELKTAVLIAASAKIGAIFGGADDKNAEILYEYGRNLGLAFQIQDDILDTYGDMKIFGKTAGGDILAGKKTFLYVKAMEIGSQEQKKRLQDLYLVETSDPLKKIKDVTEIFDHLKIRRISEDLVGDYIGIASGFIGKAAAPHERKEELLLLTGSLVKRDR
jgi:geranylgeranyl diphosphate synthase type II